MSYRREAAIRIAYFAAAAAIAFVVSLVTFAVVANVFSGADHTDGKLARDIGLAVFIILGSLLAYRADQILSKRFNQNP